MKFVAIGNLCIDYGLQNKLTFGGSVLYSSLLSIKLGLETIAIASFGKEFDKKDLSQKGIKVYSQPNASSTVFQYLSYNKKGNRRIILKKEGGSISENLLPQELSDADIIFICPVAHEISLELVSVIAKKNKKGLIVVTPQGWLRDWEKEGVEFFQTKWKNAKEILAKTDILSISDEDIKKDKSVLNVYRKFMKNDGIIIVTEGSRGATAYRGEEIIKSKAYKTKVVDPTGAGDIFAAAFAIAFRQTGSIGKSLGFANIAASFVIEGVGTSTIPNRPQIEEREKLYK